MENAVQIRGATAQDAQVFFALNLAFNGEGVASPQEAALALAPPGPSRCCWPLWPGSLRASSAGC